MLEALSVSSPVEFAYLKAVYKHGTELERPFVDQIGDVELSVLTRGTFLRTERSMAVLRISFAQLDKNCKSYGALLRVPHGLGLISQSSPCCRI